MLGASINYPLRGAVTWKSIVGTNVAADALSNLASPGVIGGALIVLGEDYGEGAGVIQERSYAYAMKSSIWVLDPRPDLPTVVHLGAKGLRTVGSGPGAGQARLARARLPCHRRVCSQRQQARALQRARPFGRPTALRLRPVVASAGNVHAGTAENRTAPAGRAAVHP